MRALLRTWAGVLLVVALPALAQSGVGVELDEVVDNRVAAGPFVGSLDLRVKVTGKNLEKVVAARILVKEAKDDKGTDVTGKGDPPDFFPREYNMGTLQVGLRTPARTASQVRVKGTVELFVPTRDPAALVKVDKALAKLDTPLSSKALKSAKIEITPLSRAGYAKLLESRKLDEKKIEAIRAEGKARGVDEKEIELMIGLAQALESSEGDLPPNAVILSGREEAFDRIYRIDVLDAEGKPIDTTTRSTSTRGDDSIMVIQPSQEPPANATLQLQLLTQKSRMSSPFDLTVELP